MSTRSTPNRLRRPRPLDAFRIGIPVLLGVCIALSARAELALLTNGDFLRIDGHELVENDRLRLDLEQGGALFLPIDRVERIVDDEIVRVADVRPPSRSRPAAPAIDLRWIAEEHPPKAPYGELFLEAGQRFQLNPHLLSAMARAESAYDPQALSHKGARGLLQLMPATAERFGVRRNELYDPRRNVEAAARYLDFLIREFDGELDLVLAAYNAGEGNVRKYAGVPPFRETQNYIRRVYRFLGIERNG